MGGLFGGGNKGAKEMREANRLMQENIERLMAIGIPSIEAQQIALTNPEFVDLLVAEQMGPSEFESIQEDPRLRQAQMQALSEMTELGQQGLGAEDRAAFNELRRQAAGQAQAQKETALQQMQERGMADSGASLVAQLSAGQQAANRMSQEGDRLAAAAAAARRQALGQQSDMASRMSQQQLALAGQKASASDAIKQFNTQSRQQTNLANTAYQQQLAAQRAANANQQTMYNAGLIQQQFQNQMAQAQAAAGVTGAQAQNLQAQAAAAQQAQQAQTGAILGTIGTIGGAALKASDKNLKKNIEKFDTEEFLDSLTPHKYDYKDEKFGKGKQHGVMAQDLEKTKEGNKLVINTPEGKMVDYGKAASGMLASLTDIHKRVKKLEGK